MSGKLTFKGKSPNLKFADELSVEKLDSKFLKKYEHVEEVLHKVIHGLKLALGIYFMGFSLHYIKYTNIQLFIGLDLQALTYSEALQYPFRTHAVKSLIVAVSKPCEKGSLLPVRFTYSDNTLTKIYYYNIQLIFSYKN